MLPCFRMNALTVAWFPDDAIKEHKSKMLRPRRKSTQAVRALPYPGRLAEEAHMQLIWSGSAAHACGT